MPPRVKPWGKIDNTKLQGLVSSGQVDITRDDDVKYIERVRFQFFRERELKNFRRNFRNFARAQELEETVSGARRSSEQGNHAVSIF